MARFMFLVVSSLLATTSVATPPSEHTQPTKLCKTVLDEAFNGTSTAPMNLLGPVESLASQAPLLGASRLWLGKSLWQRQTCDPVCQTDSGGCCSGCSNKNDGSTPCGTGCCVYPYVCGVNSECKIPVVTQSVATTVWSTSIYTSTIYITQDDTTTIVATATSVETVTITRADQPTKARRARALVTSLPESTRLPSRPVSIVTNSPPRGDDVTGLHVVAQCLDDLQTRRADAALLALHKRQATSVVIIGTVSLTTTTTSYTTSTVSASDTYYTTTTVHFTTTTNAADGRPNTSSFTDNRNNTGLSVGAKAGIGVGIGLAVILGLFIAACLWRRRGNRGLHGSSGDEQPEQVSSSTTYHATNNEKLVRESSLAPSSTAYGLIPSSSPSQSLGPYTDRAPQQTSSVAPSDTQKAMYADAQPYEMGTGTIPLHELADSSQGHYMVSSGVRY